MYDPTGPIERIALRAAARWRFALGGGRALRAYGVVNRPTVNVDLLTTDEANVHPAADAVILALTAAGFRASELEVDAEVEELIYGMADALIDLEVLTPHGDLILVSLGVQPRSQPATQLNVGPVIHIDDLAASKVAAMANRAEARDFIDVAALQQRIPRRRLLDLAREVDPGLTDEDFAASVRLLSAYPDMVFERYGADAAAVRAAFADWSH